MLQLTVRKSCKI